MNQRAVNTFTLCLMLTALLSLIVLSLCAGCQHIPGQWPPIIDGPDGPNPNLLEVQPPKCSLCNGSGIYTSASGWTGKCYSCGGTGKQIHQAPKAEAAP